MKLLLSLIGIISSVLVIAQSDQIYWEHTYGGTDQDVAYRIKPTSDGGYIACGYTYSRDGDVHEHFGNFFTDAWIIKLDQNGDTVWTHAYGGTYDELAVDVEEIATGGYMVLCASLGSSGGDISNPLGSDDFWVLRLDVNGDLVWEKTFGGSSYDTPNAIVKTYDDKFIMAGQSSSQNGDISNPLSTSYEDAWIFKMDVDGNLIWDNSYGGTDTDELYMIRETADSGFVFTGNTYSADVNFTASNGLRDMYLVKTDSLGNLEWADTYGGSGFDYGYDVIEDANGDFVLAGFSNSSNGDITGNYGDYDVVNIKTNDQGILTWSKHYGGSGDDRGYALVETLGSNYLVVGRTASSDGDVSVDYLDYEAWVVNLDLNGDIIWENSFGGDSVDVAYSVIQNMDGTYSMAGYTASNELDVDTVRGTSGYSDFWVVKLGCAPPVTQEICLVTVDSTSTKNLVVWEKPANNIAIDSFYIYREISNVYTFIGAVDYDSLSQFVDTTNGINPNITSYRYKLSSVDTLGLESSLGDFHETIHLTTNLGTNNEINLIWDPYEGFTFNDYKIWRDVTGTGTSWTLLNTISSSSTTYTDWSPPPGPVNYMIEVTPPSVCSATKSMDHNSTRSNKVNMAAPNPNGIIETSASGVSVYPNPAEDQVFIQFSDSKSRKIEITDISGRVVQLVSSGKAVENISLEAYKAGVYFVRITEENTLVVVRLIID